MAAVEATVQDEASASMALVVRCEVISVSSMKKKGRALVELRCAHGDRVQVVTDKSGIIAGQAATVALPGAVLENGRMVRREKIGGEWSEGAFIETVDGEYEASQDALDDATNECLIQDGDSDVATPAEYRVLPDSGVLPMVSIGDCTILANIASYSGVSRGTLHYVSGDASKAQYGKGRKIIAQICNDSGRWGKGFVMAITDTWGKRPGKLYRKWHKTGAEAEFGLGRVQLITLTDTVALANIIGQSGTKTGSKGPPVRYEAIRLGLDAVCQYSATVDASVHMPQIGVGLAGGEWPRIESILVYMTKRHSADIYVYQYKG